MNPYGNMSTSHSTWPVLLSIMNLPPWLYNKRKYVMLSTLVSGPKQPSDRIDVFLQPLVEDLQLLWEGVEVRDDVVNKHYTLHVMLMTTISDNPAHPDKQLDIKQLLAIREKLASFLVVDVISDKGDFHCRS